MVHLCKVHAGHRLIKVLLVLECLLDLVNLLFEAKIVVSGIFLWQMVSVQDTIHLPLDIVGLFVFD